MEWRAWRCAIFLMARQSSALCPAQIFSNRLELTLDMEHVYNIPSANDQTRRAQIYKLCEQYNAKLPFDGCICTDHDPQDEGHLATLGAESCGSPHLLPLIMDTFVANVACTQVKVVTTSKDSHLCRFACFACFACFTRHWSS